MVANGTLEGVLGGLYGAGWIGNTNGTSTSITPEQYHQAWAAQQQRATAHFDFDTDNDFVTIGKPAVVAAPKPLSFYDKLRKEIDEWIKL